MDPPPGESGKPTIIHPPPSPEVLSALKLLIEKYKGAMDEIECYIHDLTIEAQNNLLYGLFERKVPPRQPLDPRHKVISTVPEKGRGADPLFRNRDTVGKESGRHQRRGDSRSSGQGCRPVGPQLAAARTSAAK
jgi:hypothetical protein